MVDGGGREGGVRYECPNMEQQQQHSTARPAQDCFSLAVSSYVGP